jgi:hypothetical protein
MPEHRVGWASFKQARYKAGTITNMLEIFQVN